MSKFTDCEGDEWVIRIGHREIKEISEKLDLTLITMDEESEPDVELRELPSDPDKFLEVLYILTKDQARGRGMKKKEVLDRFNYGPVSGQTSAWMNAISEFILGVDIENAPEEEPEDESKKNG